MLTKTLIRDYNPKRLKGLLAFFFMALAVPTGAVIWQAYGQLKFEAFYQYRNQAEALANRIDSRLIEGINQAEARRFADFAFVNVTGDANVLQRSPLSEYPVIADVPGVIGHFQVGENGEFSTPLLPLADTTPDQVGLSPEEYLARAAVAQNIQQILADNRLVRDRVVVGGRITLEDTEFGASSDAQPATAELPEDRAVSLELGADRDGAALLENLSGSLSSNAAPEPMTLPEDKNEQYSQRAFDVLNEPARQLAAPAYESEEIDQLARVQADLPVDEYGKLDDYRFDDKLQKKSEVLKQKLAEEEVEPAERYNRDETSARARRVEQDALPTSKLQRSYEEVAGSSGAKDVRIRTFESEIDPFEFSRLDSGHLVLFRKVWRGGVQYIQGLLIDQDVFLSEALVTAYRTTTLSEMSDLIVGYRDDVVSIFRGGEYRSNPIGTGGLQGTLLHRANLSAPFDGLELVFSINRLPPGPGAKVLAWTTVIIAIVFIAGFVALYRLGISQLRLARQQQDFVSAISHELKTPLTSIRMYGEMLKEGWADEDKRMQYYEYIHDESERLTRLISNVLQLAKITRNEPQFDLQTKTVGELMNQIESKIANQVERAGFSLKFLRDEATDEATLRIDDDCFAQIVINLVDNAIKFSKNAGTKAIEIGSTLASDGTVLFTIRDHGPGVPKEQMKKIFKLFYRSESELTRETVGTGIGLAIVHQLTLAMGGKVDIINRDPGAEFRITFPVAT